MKPGFLELGIECWQIMLALNPVPAARPRVGKFGTYYPKTYSRFRIEADEILEPMAHGRTPSGELFYVNVEFRVAKPKTSKLVAPNGDVDNYVKAALDAVTKAQVLWSDDRQVAAIHAFKRFVEPGEEGIVITAGFTMGAVWEAAMGITIEPSDDVMNYFERVEFENV